MNYIFWSRRISDVDHIVPVIYSLLESGVAPVNIRYRQLWPDHTTEGINTDRRIKYLASRGVTHHNSGLQNALFRLTTFINSSRKQAGWSRKVLSTIIGQIVFKIMRGHLNIVCRSIARRHKGRAMFITDLGSSYPYNNLSKWARKYCIPMVGVPHGLAVHTGAKNVSLHRLYFPLVLPFKIFDKMIIVSQLQLDLDSEYHSPNSTILGSARYSQKWISQLEQLYPSTPIGNNGTCKVVFFSDKPGQYISGEFYAWIDTDEYVRLIRYLASSTTIQVVVKTHPSLNAQSRAPFDIEGVTLISTDSEITSFELIASADIVVGVGSSVVVDAILMRKPLIVPTYVSPFHLIFSQMDGNVAIDSFSEFGERIKSIINGDWKLNEIAYQRAEHFLVGSGDTLSRYAKFLMGIKASGVANSRNS